MFPPSIDSRNCCGSTPSACAYAMVSPTFSTVFRIQWLRTSLSALAVPTSSPSQTCLREIAGSTSSQADLAASGPARSTTS